LRRYAAPSSIVLRADLSELLVGVAAADSRVQQRDQRVRDADERGVNDDWPHSLVESFAKQARDDGPVLGRRHAAATEFEHDPR
jgi:hypothetical protein